MASDTVKTRYGIINVEDGTASRDVTGFPANSPRLEMGCSGTHEFHVAIDARTGVPARIGFARVVDPYCKHIVSFTQIWSKVVIERNVSVWPLTEQMPVEIHFASVVDTFKIYERHIRVLGRCLETLAVPANATRKKSGTGIERWRRQRLYAPVMRQIEHTPCGIVVRN